MSRGTQKVEIDLANDQYGLAFFIMDLQPILGSIIGIELEVMLRGKDLRKQNLLTTLSAFTLS